MNSKLITPVGGKILAAVGRGGYANWDGPVDFGLVAIYEREIDGPVYNFKFHRSWNDKLKSTIRIGSYQEKK
mgnify:CR=1 FL=1